MNLIQPFILLLLLFLSSLSCYSQNEEQEKNFRSLNLAVQPISIFKPYDKTVFSKNLVIPISITYRLSKNLPKTLYYDFGLQYYQSYNYLEHEKSNYMAPTAFVGMGFKYALEKFTFLGGVSVMTSRVFDRVEGFNYIKQLNYWSFNGVLNVEGSYLISTRTRVHLGALVSLKKQAGLSIGISYQL